MPAQTVYLDHAATSPVLPAVRESMAPYLDDRFANASSLYAEAREARKGIEEAREIIAEAVGARPDEIVFTSGGTEADNLALQGAAFRARNAGRDVIVVSAIEHHAVLDTARWLGRNGFRVQEVKVTRDGVVDLDALRAAVDAKTAIVSVMAANNEVGTIQPVNGCAAIARDGGALFHTDAVQALPWLDLRTTTADLIALAAHKVGGPKGVGALVVRRGTSLEPIVHGGGQERGLRSGTYNVAGIVGFGAAVRETQRTLTADAERVAALRDDLQAKIAQRLDRVAVSGEGADRLPNNCHLRIAGVEADSLLLLLDAAGVAASSGSACQTGAVEPSHVLLAMGIGKRDAMTALRLTLGRQTTADDVDFAVEQIVAAVGKLRR